MNVKYKNVSKYTVQMCLSVHILNLHIKRGVTSWFDTMCWYHQQWWFHMKKNDTLMELFHCQIFALCSSNIWQWRTLTVKHYCLSGMMRMLSVHPSPSLNVMKESLYTRAAFTFCLLCYSRAVEWGDYWIAHLFHYHGCGPARFIGWNISLISPQLCACSLLTAHVKTVYSR